MRQSCVSLDSKFQLPEDYPLRGELVDRVAWKLQIGQAHVPNHNLISPDIGRRLKIRHSAGTARTARSVNGAGSYEVILIDSIPANT